MYIIWLAANASHFVAYSPLLGNKLSQNEIFHSLPHRQFSYIDTVPLFSSDHCQQNAQWIWSTPLTEMKIEGGCMRYHIGLDNISFPPTTTPPLVAMVLPPLHAQLQKPGQNIQPVPLLIVSVTFPTLHGFRIIRRSNGLFIQTLRHWCRKQNFEAIIQRHPSLHE